MNYKTIILCAVIGASMQNVHGMFNDTPRDVGHNNGNNNTWQKPGNKEIPAPVTEANQNSSHDSAAELVAKLEVMMISEDNKDK